MFGRWMISMQVFVLFEWICVGYELRMMSRMYQLNQIVLSPSKWFLVDPNNKSRQLLCRFHIEKRIISIVWARGLFLHGCAFYKHPSWLICMKCSLWLLKREGKTELMTNLNEGKKFPGQFISTLGVRDWFFFSWNRN